MKVLLVDDDVELAELFAEYLQQEGFVVEMAYDGESGLLRALSGEFALVILDVMLPGIKGSEVLVRIRRDSSVPVLMFTAKGDDVDKIIGLESGADDYVPKPCTPRELVARIRAILRRMQLVAADENHGAIVAGPLKMWPTRRKAEWFGQALALTSTEYNVLEVLAGRCGQVVSKQDLSLQGLGRPLARFDRSIDVHISSIRQKLGGQADGESYIQTVRGKGYQFVQD